MFPYLKTVFSLKRNLIFFLGGVVDGRKKRKSSGSFSQGSQPSQKRKRGRGKTKTNTSKNDVSLFSYLDYNLASVDIR